MSYARPHITTRIIPRSEKELAVRAGLTVLIGRPDSGVSDYAASLERHPRRSDLKVLQTGHYDTHVQRDWVVREAMEEAGRGEVVFLEMIGAPSVEGVLRVFQEAGVSPFRLQTVLSMIITFERVQGRVTTEVHRVEINRLGLSKARHPFVGC